MEADQCKNNLKCREQIKMLKKKIFSHYNRLMKPKMLMFFIAQSEEQKKTDEDESQRGNNALNMTLINDGEAYKKRMGRAD